MMNILRKGKYTIMMENYSERRSYEIKYDRWIARNMKSTLENQKSYKELVFKPDPEPEEDAEFRYKIESVKYVINGKVYGKRMSNKYRSYIGKVIVFDPSTIEKGNNYTMNCVREFYPHMKYDEITTAPVVKVKEDGDYLYIKTEKCMWELRCVS